MTLRRRPVLGMILHENGDEGDAFDVEAVRQQLESMVTGNFDGRRRRDDLQPTISTSVRSNKDFLHKLQEMLHSPDAPPLTSIERERREAEIRMLLHLKHGDDALEDLWNLWFQERGTVEAGQLARAQQLSNHQRTWEQAEVALLELIETYGVHWVEPMNRLATLYYMQGKLKESEALCKIVIAIKPWHFGALSGIVMVYAGLHEVNEARHWAVHRLPTFAPTGSNRRREQWVQKAVHEAQDSLEAAERRLQDSFGTRDYDIVDISNTYFNELDDKDCWQ